MINNNYTVVWNGRGLLRPLGRETEQGRGVADTPGDAAARAARTRDVAENWDVVDPRGGGGMLKFGRRKGARQR